MQLMMNRGQRKYRNAQLSYVRTRTKPDIWHTSIATVDSWTSYHSSFRHFSVTLLHVLGLTQLVQYVNHNVLQRIIQQNSRIGLRLSACNARDMQSQCVLK